RPPALRHASDEVDEDTAAQAHTFQSSIVDRAVVQSGQLERVRGSVERKARISELPDVGVVRHVNAVALTMPIEDVVQERGYPSDIAAIARVGGVLPKVRIEAGSVVGVLLTRAVGDVAGDGPVAVEPPVRQPADDLTRQEVGDRLVGVALRYPLVVPLENIGGHDVVDRDAF